MKTQMNAKLLDATSRTIVTREGGSAAAVGTPHSFKRAVGYGALFGLILAPAAAALTVGFDSALIYFRYAIHWGVGFSAIGAWVGAMFFSGENGGVAKPG
jgi:hypothetical protein